MTINLKNTIRDELFKILDVKGFDSSEIPSYEAFGEQLNPEQVIYAVYDKNVRGIAFTDEAVSLSGIKTGKKFILNYSDIKNTTVVEQVVLHMDSSHLEITICDGDCLRIHVKEFIRLEALKEFLGFASALSKAENTGTE